MNEAQKINEIREFFAKQLKAAQDYYTYETGKLQERLGKNFGDWASERFDRLLKAEMALKEWTMLNQSVIQQIEKGDKLEAIVAWIRDIRDQYVRLVLQRMPCSTNPVGNQIELFRRELLSQIAGTAMTDLGSLFAILRYIKEI
jgi:hypothetical protein